MQQFGKDIQDAARRICVFSNSGFEINVGFRFKKQFTI